MTVENPKNDGPWFQLGSKLAFRRRHNGGVEIGVEKDGSINAYFSIDESDWISVISHIGYPGATPAENFFIATELHRGVL